MEEYPKTLAELEREFATEEACARYLFQLRWPDGFVCPRGGGTPCWTTKRALSTCAQCQYQLSVKAGTLLAGSRSSLTTWFRAIWWVTSQQNGASAKGLDYYLDEYTFRFNRRTSRYRGKLFYRLIQQAVAIEPVPYAALVKQVRGPKPKKHKI